MARVTCLMAPAQLCQALTCTSRLFRYPIIVNSGSKGLYAYNTLPWKRRRRQNHHLRSNGGTFRRVGQTNARRQHRPGAQSGGLLEYSVHFETKTTVRQSMGE